MKNPSLIGEPHRLSGCSCADQESISIPTLRSPFRVTSCSDFASSPERVRNAKGPADKKGSDGTVGGAVGNHQALSGQPRRRHHGGAGSMPQRKRIFFNALLPLGLLAMAV